MVQMRMLQMRGTLALICCLFTIGVLGCKDRKELRPEGAEQNSALSPDGRNKVFVWYPDTKGTLGATVSPTYQIWLQGLRDIKKEQLILTSDKTGGFSFNWRGPANLDVCYVSAQIFGFRNTVALVDEPSRSFYEVEVVLRKVPTLGECKSP